MSDGGKGSAPRKERQDDKFRENWERIFGRKKVVNLDDLYQPNDAAKAMEGKPYVEWRDPSATKASPPDSTP